MPAQISIDEQELRDFCRKHGIRRMALFGSVLRDDFNPESDVDVLVELQPDVHIGYIGLADLELKLANILGRKVDLNTARELHERFRDQALSEAEVVYSG